MHKYNFFEKILHDLILSNKFINKSLYEIEKIFFLEKKKINTNHIFISGLPRSGTTALLNFIYSSDEFASLKYSNMPFLLAPNLSSLINKKKIKKIERPHQDGIKYDINSPGSFDEIFFSEDKKYVKSEIKNYFSLILKSQNKRRYLSKNNSNYRNINLIKSIFPKSKILITIRHPFYQAFSLFNQHINFSKLQSKDSFILRYMNYLNHNEFGLNHIPWNKPILYNDLNDVNYWLEQWCLFYEKILNNYKKNKISDFIIYEKLSSKKYLKRMLRKIELLNNKKIKINSLKNKNINKKNLNIIYNKYLIKKSILIYNKFKKINN